MRNRDSCAIVGIGATEFSKESGRSEMRLALEAITNALHDAGIAPHTVNGLVTFSMDNNEEVAVQRSLGIERLTFFAHSGYGGGGGCSTVELAEMAIICGKADVVVCYRAMNERSQSRFGQPVGESSGGLKTALTPSWDIDLSWSLPYGMSTPGAQMAQAAQRYLYQYGATSETFARVAVNQRNYAVTNPNAYFHGRPITIEDHQNSRLIADPLRLLDCCQESDGGVAVVVTSLERARDLKQKPIQILGSAQGSGRLTLHGLASPYVDNLAAAFETKVVADQLWAQTGLTPADIDVANLYDHFSCAVVMQLEALGFCGLGEAPGLIAEGGLAIDGQIPTNTNGGQLSEAYMHGFNGIAELVRQLRGTAINQVRDAKLGVATSGSHVPTSGLVLGAVD